MYKNKLVVGIYRKEESYISNDFDFVLFMIFRLYNNYLKYCLISY